MLLDNCTYRHPWVWLWACIAAAAKSVVGDHRQQNRKPENAAKESWEAWPDSYLLHPSGLAPVVMPSCSHWACFVFASQVFIVFCSQEGYRVWYFYAHCLACGGGKFVN